LASSPKGKPHRAQRRRRHREQEVRLVLVGIDGPPQGRRTVGARRDPTVVAGGQDLGADRAGLGQKRRELDVLVALHARVGGLPGQVGGDEVLDHRVGELGLEVDHVVGDAEVVGDPAGVLDVARPAAATARGAGGPRVVEPHGHADHAVTGGDQERGRGRRVDAARQRDHDGARRGGRSRGRDGRHGRSCARPERRRQAR
jgi:hypothetical protein